MTHIDIEDNLYKELKKFYSNQDKVDYPTFKNFIEKKLKEIILKKKKFEKIKEDKK